MLKAAHFFRRRTKQRSRIGNYPLFLNATILVKNFLKNGQNLPHNAEIGQILNYTATKICINDQKIFKMDWMKN